LGKLNLPGSTRNTISLRSLTEQFLQSKKGEVRAASLQRYSNYSSRLIDFFESLLPIQAADVSLIEKKHMREFLDSMQEGDDAWVIRVQLSIEDFERT
jgi:hypothetical protein